MRIENLRVGFATNSSSSHSVIILPPGRTEKDEWDGVGEFGWECFTLASDKAKREYLKVALYDPLAQQVGKDLAHMILPMLLGVRSLDIDESDYIDHQSVPTIPKAFDGGVALEYIEALVKFINRPDVLILGGNDNDGEHPLITTGVGTEVRPWSTYGSEGLMRVRRDGDWWTLFDDATGNKLRLNFEQKCPENNWEIEELGLPVVPRPLAPELVDIKITSACSRGCAYCYADSKPDGKHSDARVWTLAKALGNMHVFEAALGGGEPTEHPDFTDWIRELRENGVIPNFTTHSTRWMRDVEIVDAVKKYCGGIGFSVNHSYEAKDVLSIANAAGLNMRRISLMVIPELLGSDLDELLDIARLFKVTVTMLGYKTCGRGSEKGKSSHTLSKAWDVIKKKNEGIGLWNVAMDTLLVSQWRTQLESIDVPRLLHAPKEGELSCFIDAVDGKMAASSYTGETFEFPISELYDDTCEQKLRDIWVNKIKPIEM